MLVARVTPNSLRESGAHAVMFSYEIPVTCPIVHLIFVCVCVCVCVSKTCVTAEIYRAKESRWLVSADLTVEARRN